MRMHVLVGAEERNRHEAARKANPIGTDSLVESVPSCSRITE
jgi:hypothetical protein